VRGLAIRHDQPRRASALIDAVNGAASPPPRRRFSGESLEIVKRASEIEATAPTAGGAMTIGGSSTRRGGRIAPSGARARQSLRPEPSVVALESHAATAGSTARRRRFERVSRASCPMRKWQVLVDKSGGCSATGSSESVCRSLLVGAARGTRCVALSRSRCRARWGLRDHHQKTWASDWQCTADRRGDGRRGIGPFGDLRRALHVAGPVLA